MSLIKNMTLSSADKDSGSKNNSEFQNYRNNLKEIKLLIETKKFTLALACREVLNKSAIYAID